MHVCTYVCWLCRNRNIMKLKNIRNNVFAALAIYQNTHARMQQGEMHQVTVELIGRYSEFSFLFFKKKS